MMKINSFLVFFLFLVFKSNAQKIYAVDHASQADVKVFVADYQSQADLLVYKVPVSYTHLTLPTILLV